MMFPAPKMNAGPGDGGSSEPLRLFARVADGRVGSEVALTAGSAGRAASIRMQTPGAIKTAADDVLSGFRPETVALAEQIGGQLVAEHQNQLSQKTETGQPGQMNEADGKTCETCRYWEEVSNTWTQQIDHASAGLAAGRSYKTTRTRQGTCHRFTPANMTDVRHWCEAWEAT